MIKVAALTGGIRVPSARFRVRQYIEALKREGIALDEMWSILGSYPPIARWQRPAWALATLAAQLPNVIKSHRYDAVLLQREMLSTFVTLEPFTGRPRILDVDDAIFLLRGGCFAKKLAQSVDSVICGNSYLAERFIEWNRNIEVIATAVDTVRYMPIKKDSEECAPIVVGWIGTSANLKYLYDIELAFVEVILAVPNVMLRIVCDKAPLFKFIPPDRIEYLPWSEDTEVESIQGMDVGIMPLEDSEWARGKCSFKMLQYMACGLPVIVSPVGMNLDVLALDAVGVGAATLKQWTDALIDLLRDSKARLRMGSAGRLTVEKYYSVNVVSPQIAKVLKGV